MCPPRFTRFPRALATFLAASAFVLGLGACGPASQVTHFSPIVDVPKVAHGARRTAPLPRSKGVLTAVCGERPGCRVLGRRAAGADAEGRSIDVVTAVSSLPGLDPPAAEVPAEVVMSDEGDEAETDGVATVVTEYWMVVLDEGQVVSSQLLAELEGPEGRGRREDEVKVGENFFRLARSGGSNRQWEESSELQLSPLGPRSWARRSWTLTAGATAYEEERWDWAEFRGQTVWFEEACEGRERAAGAPPFPPPGELPAEPYFAYAALPSVELDDAYASGLWRETGLGRCALRIDGGAGGGYALQGRADGAGDSSLRAVLGADGRSLYVEAFDDKLVGPGGAVDDRVEVLVDAAPAAEPSRRCGEGQGGGGAKLAAWSIRASDGALVGAKGRPGQGAPRVEHVRAGDGRSVRLKVTLAGPTPGAITIAYHDTDDGRRVERTFASSRLRRGDARSLGNVRALAPHEATCRPREGRLEPEFAASFDPAEPVVSALRMAP
jgi:hypothetical protein